MEPACTDMAFQIRPALGSNLEVVFEDNGLAVQCKGTEPGFLVQDLEERVHERHEPRPIDLEWLVPFAVPVGVGD